MIRNMLGRVEMLRVCLPPLNAGQLKRFAVCTMLIDHIAAVFLELTTGRNGLLLMDSFPGGRKVCWAMRAVGRQAFPIFCFFLVEGFFHTRSRSRYLARIAAFGLLAQYPFQKCIFPMSGILHANTLCTMALGLLAIWTVEMMGEVFLPREESPESPVPAAAGTGQGFSARGAPPGSPAPAAAGKGETQPVLSRLFSPIPAKEAADSLVRRALFLVSAGGSVYGLCRLAGFLHSDYRHGGVGMIVILYLLREYRIPALFFSGLWLWWYNHFEVYAIPALILLAGFNGKRGKQHKYFFYIFYPAHLAVLWIVHMIFFGG